MSKDRLAELVLEQVAAEKFVAACEEQLKDAKEELRKLSWEAIPELMEEMGYQDFTTTEGVKVSVKETIRASINKENLPLALVWLKENGHGKLIKHDVKVNVKSEEQAEEVKKALGKKFQLALNPSVNAQSLSAFVRHALADGVDLPLQLLGVFRQREAKIKYD